MICVAAPLGQPNPNAVLKILCFQSLFLITANSALLLNEGLPMVLLSSADSLVRILVDFV
jgi:hypothetical protein